MTPQAVCELLDVVISKYGREEKSGYTIIWWPRVYFASHILPKGIGSGD